MTQIEAISDLITQAKQTLNPSTAAPVVSALENRLKWEQIKREYALLRSRGMKSYDAKEELASKFYYSIKNIDAILYER